MRLIDTGTGTPLVLVPGIQGRWEYMRPAVDALSAHFRVLTCSLDDAPSLETHAAQIAALLDRSGVERAVICGVSFGGMVALQFAASYPERTAFLILASTPAPVFRLRKRHEIYARLPWVFGPLFLAEVPWRLRREIAAALPDRRARRRFRLDALRTFASARLSFSRMAARARLMTAVDLRPVCAKVSARTLIVTGERLLDFVVPVDGSSMYAKLIPNARAVVLERTGHLGSITRPEAFASVIKQFVDHERHAAA